jgi:hypothetical protein
MPNVTIPGQIDLKDLLTTGGAIIGTVLGVINFVLQLRQRRVKLIVVPKLAYETDGGHFILEDTNLFRGKGRPAAHTPLGRIEIKNLSAFPVTVDKVGFTINADAKSNPYLVIKQPIVSEGSWPRRLEARSSVTVEFQWDWLHGDVLKAFVETSCGTIAYGSSRALKFMRKQSVRSEYLFCRQMT